MNEFIVFAIGFLASAIMASTLIPWMIPKLKARGVVGRDLNKPGAPNVAEMGGIAVVIAFFAGVSILISLDGVTDDRLLYVSLIAVLGTAFVGIVDDLFDLRQAHKALLPFILALPFGVVLDTKVVFPHVGVIDFGMWMPIVAALAVTCAANAANMLEGFNGLGTGLGIIMSFTLVELALVHNRLDGIYILVPLLGTLISFLWFNKYPAKIFPGDTMLLFMGATIAVAGMLSQIQVQTFFIFLPMIIEFLLKTRGRFRAENYSSESSGGFLRYQGKVESITHLFMRGYRLTERRLVLILWTLEGVVCAIVITVDLIA